MQDSRRKPAPYPYLRTPYVYPAAFSISLTKKLIVEIGPGRGDFLFELARQNPDATVVGIEIKPNRIDKIIKRIERMRIPNVLLIQSDAREALPRFFGRSSIDELHIQFPDPWPKKRHHKNRSMSPEFLSECASRLKNGAVLEFITDHKEYFEVVKEFASQVKDLTPVSRDDSIFPTFFAMKWRSEGRSFHLLKLEKRP